MNKPKNSVRRSTSPRSVSVNSVNRNTSRKSNTARSAFGQAFVEDKLRKNRERLTHTLDTFTMLIRSNNPIRCLEHNSVVSVYCQSDNKLLCSNCIFGKSQHKYHKVTPIDRGEDKLIEQIQKMNSVVQKEIKTIGGISESILDNLQTEQHEMHKTLNTLTSRYKQAHQLLDECFTRSKQTLISNMKNLTVKHQTVALQLNFLKEVYSSCAPRYLNQSDIQETKLQELLFQHSVLRTITGQQKFQGNFLPKIQPTFHLLGQQQIAKISPIVSELSKHLQQADKN